MTLKSLSLVAGICAACSVFATDIKTDPAMSNPAPVAPVSRPSNPNTDGLKTKEEALAKLAEKSAEMADLRLQTAEAVGRMADIAKNPDYMASQEGAAALAEIANQLKEINERLAALEKEVEDIKGWIEGQSEALPILTNDVANLNRFRPSAYMQFQYRNQTKNATQQAGFRNRRIRIGATTVIDPKTSIRYSFDLGTGTNQTAAQLRDAVLIYDVIPSDTQVGLQIRAGQHAVQLGYELERSSADREFPERARYNTTLMDGERSTGISASYGVNQHLSFNVGMFNSMTFNDPEQRNTGNDGTAKKFAGLAGFRWSNETLSFGVSSFWGHRPSFAVAKGSGATDPSNIVAPEIKRQLNYADVTWLPGFLPGSFIRAEYMWGRDRNNLGLASSATSRPDANSYRDVPVYGWHAIFGYNLDTRNQISLKMEEFDPNRRVSLNSIRAIGIGYQYWIGPTAKIGFFGEEFKEPGRKYKVWTIRTTFRF